MADASDQTTKTTEGIISPGSLPGTVWTGGDTGLGTVPTETQPYRPLSLLAIGAFLLAVFYGILVSAGGLAAFATRRPVMALVLLLLAPLFSVGIAVLGKVTQPVRLLAYAGLSLAILCAVLGMASIVAFSGTTPWLLPDWTIVIPIAAALLAWVARMRIAGAEGTLGGTALTSWGIGLSLVFGLNYGAYMLSTTLAVRKQANDFTEEWLGYVRNGEIERAFRLMLPPGGRPADGPRLREELETGHNVPLPNAGGMLSLFTQSHYVRLIEQSGKDVPIQRARTSWRYEGGGYRVTSVYTIKSVLGDWELHVELFGSESTTGKGGGRQWQILQGYTRVGENPTMNDLGREVDEYTRDAGGFTRKWLENLQEGNLDEAYLATLPPAERRRQKEALDRCPPVSLSAEGLDRFLSAVEKDSGYRDFLLGRQAFLEGNLVKVDQTFWAARQFRSQIVQAVKSLFQLSPQARPAMYPQARNMPRFKQKEGSFELLFDVRILTPVSGSQPPFAVEGELVLENSLQGGKASKDSWRVAALQLVRGQTAPRMTGAPLGR
jgi:hypothetical protein